MTQPKVPNKPKSAEEQWRDRMRTNRTLLLTGLIAPDSASGIVIVGCCKHCEELTGYDIPLRFGRGDKLRWRCACGKLQRSTLDHSFLLPAIGGDGDAVLRTRGKRRQ